jgi:hypothetical protein
MVSPFLGDKSTLLTTDKSSLVGAMNELFTSVSDGKELLASTIADYGLSVGANPSFADLDDKIRQIKFGTMWEPFMATYDLTRALSYCNDKLLLHSTSGVAYSTDEGASWTLGTLPDIGGGTIQCFIYAAGIYVAGAGGGKLIHSTDGIVWSVASTMIDTTSNWLSIAYGNGVFVAVSNTGKICYSADGSNWTEGTGITAPQYFNKVAFGNGIFVAPSAYGVIYTSTNGSSWTQRTAPSTNQWLYVCFGNGMFVLFSSTGTGRLIYSTDGISWSVASMDTSEVTFNLFFANGNFFIMTALPTTNHLTIYKTPDLVNYFVSYPLVTSSPTFVCYTGTNMMIASGSGKLILRSKAL